MSPKETQNQICCYFSILHNLNPKIQNVKCQKWESGKLRKSHHLVIAREFLTLFNMLFCTFY